MPTKTSSNDDTASRKKSLFGSLTDRRSRRSLVYNVREAESSSDTTSCDPVEDKLDKLSDDLHSLQNTLLAVAHRVQDLEKIISDQRAVSGLKDHEEPDEVATSSHQVIRAQVHRVKSSSETSLRKRKPVKHDINQNEIIDITTVPTSQPLPPPPKVIQSANNTKPKRPKYDLDSVLKHELYRSVPKIIVDCCNLIEDHATMHAFDRLYLLTGNWDEAQIVLSNYLNETNYGESINKVQSMHTLATIVKVFLQELRYPIVSMSEIQAFLGTNMTRWESASNGEKVDAMQKLMKSLPEANRDTLRYFVRHLRRLSRDYPKKVRSQELAVHIAPCMFQIFKQKPKTSQENLRDDYLITYLQFMISHCDSIFKVNQRTKFRKTLERCISCPGLFNL